jgi:nicotinamidase-related amidase
MTAMTSLSIREPALDQLLTPRNAALIIIDFQPVQVSSIRSMDQELLIHNVVRVARLATLYDLPIVLSTVNAATGVNKPTMPQLQEVLTGIEPTDRTSINAWEDAEFVRPVQGDRSPKADHGATCGRPTRSTRPSPP